MTLIINGENDPTDVHAGGEVSWPFTVTTDASRVTFSFSISTGPDADEAPDWTVLLKDSGDELWGTYSSKPQVRIDDLNRSKRQLSLAVIGPKGARYGDTVEVTMQVSAEGETDEKVYSARAVQSIIALKTQIDQEKSVVDSLSAKANIGQKDIYAILSPATLRGYVFVEGMNTDRMHEKTKDIKKARKFVDGETSITEIDHYLTPLSTVVGIVEGDLVELVNGPFKGEKARVQQIDQAKEEITVELIEAMVPIPVTVKGDSVRVIEKEK